MGMGGIPGCQRVHDDNSVIERSRVANIIINQGGPVSARPAKYSHDCSSLLHYRHGPSQLKNNWTAGQAPAYEAAQQVFDGFCFGMLGLIGFECTPMIPPQTCRPTAYQAPRRILEELSKNTQDICSLKNSFEQYDCHNRDHHVRIQ